MTATASSAAGGRRAEEEFTKPFSVVFRPPHTPHPQCVKSLKWIQILLGPINVTRPINVNRKMVFSDLLNTFFGSNS